jgi:hypothetical protein
MAPRGVDVGACLALHSQREKQKDRCCGANSKKHFATVPDGLPSTVTEPCAQIIAAMFILRCKNELKRSIKRTSTKQFG